MRLLRVVDQFGTARLLIAGHEASRESEIARRLMPSLELAVPLVLDEKSGYSWGDMEAAR